MSEVLLVSVPKSRLDNVKGNSGDGHAQGEKPTQHEPGHAFVDLLSEETRRSAGPVDRHAPREAKGAAVDSSVDPALSPKGKKHRAIQNSAACPVPLVLEGPSAAAVQSHQAKDKRSVEAAVESVSGPEHHVMLDSNASGGPAAPSGAELGMPRMQEKGATPPLEVTGREPPSPPAGSSSNGKSMPPAVQPPDKEVAAFAQNPPANSPASGGAGAAPSSVAGFSGILDLKTVQKGGEPGGPHSATGTIVPPPLPVSSAQAGGGAVQVGVQPDGKASEPATGAQVPSGKSGASVAKVVAEAKVPAGGQNPLESPTIAAAPLFDLQSAMPKPLLDIRGLTSAIVSPLKLGNGTFTVSVMLQPAHLGQVDAVVSLHHNLLEVSITSMTQTGHDAIQASMDALKSELSRDGLNVSVSLHQGDSQSGRSPLHERQSPASLQHSDTTRESPLSVGAEPVASGQIHLVL